MENYVYIIQSTIDHKFYIGETSDLNRRINEHNEGKVKSTRHRRPFSLIYYENFNSRSDALKREKQIKSYKGGNAFKALLLKKC